MKFSAVFLTTIAGSALANPVAVPNADNKAKRALPLGTVGVPGPVAGLLNGGGSGAVTDALAGLPIGLPAGGTLSGLDLQTLISTFTDLLVVNVGQTAVQLFKVLSGIQGAGGATGAGVPALPALPAGVTLPQLADPNVVDKISPEQIRALIDFFTAQLKNATNINSKIPTLPLTNIPLLSGDQVQTFTPKIQFIQATLQAIVARLRDLNTDNVVPIPTDALPAFNGLSAPLALLSNLVSALLGRLLSLGGRK